MTLRKIAFLFVGLLAPFSGRANFDFNANCIRAYKEIVSLRLPNARTLIAAEKREHPQNAITVLLDNYVDYFSIMLSENKAEFDKLKEAKSTRLNRIERDDKNSPWYLFCQAEINLQWALTRSVFQEYFNSSLEINRAFKLFQENAKKYPAFSPNQKGLGMINALLGSLPDGLKRTMSFIGVRGNTATGLKMLESLANTLPATSFSFFYDEVVFCLTFVQTNILANAAAYPQLVRYTQKIDTSSLLRTYLLAYPATRSAHNDDALAALQNRPSGSDYQPFPFLDYLAGTCRLHKLDLAAANSLQAYTQRYTGVNYTKDAYLNLAFIALLKGNTTGYRDLIAQLKSKGGTTNEKDRQALNEAADPPPNVDLLKARLLFDGGYYAQAQKQLQDKTAASFGLLRDKIEFYYRMGRISDQTGTDEQALGYYGQAITLGRKERYYFAANAALLSGMICEKRKDTGRARSFYKTAADLEDHDYEKSIESKAKEGLKRTGD